LNENIKVKERDSVKAEEEMKNLNPLNFHAMTLEYGTSGSHISKFGVALIKKNWKNYFSAMCPH
jgi:hypothetical protein